MGRAGPGGWRSGSGSSRLMVAISVLVIDVGYGFEGVGHPARQVRVRQPVADPAGPAGDGPARASRTSSSTPPGDTGSTGSGARSSGRLPVPLPRHYLLGFDEQKIETEGSPTTSSTPDLPHDDSRTDRLYGLPRRRAPAVGLVVLLPGHAGLQGPRGDLGPGHALGRRPGRLEAVEGPLGRRGRGPGDPGRGPGGDELPDRHLPGPPLHPADLPLRLHRDGQGRPLGRPGWRAPGGGRRRRSWRARWRRTRRRSASIHPHYLAYFNWVSGGPDRGSEHLIDSNLDWGQDLVTLDRWLRANHPGRRVGLAYFGQINPSLLAAPGGGVRLVPAPGPAGDDRRRCRAPTRRCWSARPPG